MHFTNSRMKLNTLVCKILLKLSKLRGSENKVIIVSGILQASRPGHLHMITSKVQTIYIVDIGFTANMLLGCASYHPYHLQTSSLAVDRSHNQGVAVEGRRQCGDRLHEASPGALYLTHIILYMDIYII